jgi:hypothetical protein
VGDNFDIVTAGAIIEHLSDPVYSIGAWAKVAREAVIIQFTNVVDTDELCMTPMTSWKDSNVYYAWWMLSRGLYVRAFDNVGFDVEFAVSEAQNNAGPVVSFLVSAQTLVGERGRVILAVPDKRKCFDLFRPSRRPGTPSLRTGKSECATRPRCTLTTPLTW